MLRVAALEEVGSMPLSLRRIIGVKTVIIRL
jgi:hypothetical protein